MTHVALIVKEDGLIYVNEVPEEPEYCREFKGTDCQGSECHCMLHKIRYDRALDSAKENAVLCADQEQAQQIIIDDRLKRGDVPPFKYRGSLVIGLGEGIYPIPDLQWDIKFQIKRYAEWETTNEYHIIATGHIPAIERRKVAILTLSEQPKEEESQKELIDELIHETFGASLAGREAIAKKFTITRNLKENQ